MKKSQAKDIIEYLPPRITPTKLFQVWIDIDLLEDVKGQRARDQISWRALVEACFKRYLDESRARK